MQRQNLVLCFTLDRHETHRGPGYRLTDRLGVIRIVLVAFPVGLYKTRIHKSYSMTELLELARPVVCAAAGFHAHQTRRQIAQKLQQPANSLHSLGQRKYTGRSPSLATG